MLRALALLLAILSLVPACAKRRPPSPDVMAAEPPPPLPPFATASDDDDGSAAALWTVEVADGATLRVNYRGAQILSFHYLFWGNNFSWANHVVKNARTKDGATTFDLDIDSLGLKIAGKIGRGGPGELVVEYAITAARKLEDITGGGLEF